MCSDSHSIKALKIALDLVKKQGAEARMLDLSKTILPFREQGVPAPMQVKETADKVVRVDAFVLVSPDYHGSISSATKNFIDNFYPEFAGKVFAYIVASQEEGLTAMDQMWMAGLQTKSCQGA